MTDVKSPILNFSDEPFHRFDDINAHNLVGWLGFTAKLSYIMTAKINSLVNR